MEVELGGLPIACSGGCGPLIAAGREAAYVHGAHLTGRIERAILVLTDLYLHNSSCVS